MVDVELQSGDQKELWIYIDTEEADVTVSQCAAISREAADLMDEQISESNYRLNVSSPGLSRPLTDKRQYRKNRGRLARIKYKTEQEYKKVVGRIEKADHETVVLSDAGEDTPIPLESIVETKIVPEF